MLSMRLNSKTKKQMKLLLFVVVALKWKESGLEIWKHESKNFNFNK
jgi:hypothetical protein